MNSFGSLSILFLILIVLAVILIYLQKNEYFRDLVPPSPHGINTNNNSSNYQFANKSPYKHFLKNPELKYLGWTSGGININIKLVFKVSKCRLVSKTIFKIHLSNMMVSGKRMFKEIIIPGKLPFKTFIIFLI